MKTSCQPRAHRVAHMSLNRKSPCRIAPVLQGAAPVETLASPQRSTDRRRGWKRFPMARRGRFGTSSRRNPAPPRSGAGARGPSGVTQERRPQAGCFGRRRLRRRGGAGVSADRRWPHRTATCGWLIRGPRFGKASGDVRTASKHLAPFPVRHLCGGRKKRSPAPPGPRSSVDASASEHHVPHTPSDRLPTTRYCVQAEADSLLALPATRRATRAISRL